MAHRRTAFALAVPVVATGVAVLPAASAWAQTERLTASAVGANEPGGGDPDASAEATFRIDAPGGDFCYRVSAKGLPKVVGMHIHKGPAGTNGPIVIPLDPARIGAGETCTAAKPALLEKIASDPGAYYFNVHTPQFKAGAVRDQLSPAAPVAVDAGTGGQADPDRVPVVPLALISVGLAVMGATGWRLARR